MAKRVLSRLGRRGFLDSPLFPSLLLSASLLGSAAFLANGSRSSQEAAHDLGLVERARGESSLVRVPVPASGVPAGARLGSVRFTHIRLPQEDLPEDVILDLSPYEEAHALSYLPAKAPLFAENISLGGEGKSNPLIARIPPGMRAMTLRVDETSAVEGWASSGAIVDVLLIDEKHTRVVAEKVKILSAERSLHSLVGEEEGDVAVPSTVTLLVTQEQCLAIHTALGLGKISFALRGLVDQEQWRNGSFAARNLGLEKEKTKTDIRGYASVQGKKSFVLMNGRWVPAAVRNPLAVPHTEDAQEAGGMSP